LKILFADHTGTIRQYRNYSIHPSKLQWQVTRCSQTTLPVMCIVFRYSLSNPSFMLVCCMHKTAFVNLYSSKSTCSICCGFYVQLAIQQIHNKSNEWSLSCRPYNELYNKSTASPQLSTSPITCCTKNPSQIHNKSEKWSLSLSEFNIQEACRLIAATAIVHERFCLDLKCGSFVPKVDNTSTIDKQLVVN
jgi:hypothetical protein